LRTASFREVRSGAGRISIARYAPRRYPEGYATYPLLAPGAWFKKVSEAEYRARYATILSSLDPQETWDQLHALAGAAEPILLCWERSRDCALGTTYCHRHIVAAWFAATLNVKIPEAGAMICNRTQKGARE
jgi:hypothetical protein